MTISRLITAVFEPGSRTGTNVPMPLRIGSLLRGEVLEIRPDGRVLIEFGQTRVLAEVRFPIETGTLICARVESAGKPLRLTHLPQAPNQPDRDIANPPPYLRHQEAAFKGLSALIDRVVDERTRGTSGRPLPETVRQALTAIRHLCLPLDLNEQTQLIAGQLKRWLENSGVYFEQRLARLLTNLSANAEPSSTNLPSGQADAGELIRADLKANLIILKDFFNRGSQKEFFPALSLKELEEFKSIVELLLGEMEDRLHTIIKNRDAEHFLFSHLLNLTPGSHRGLLQVKVPARQPKSPDTDVRLSLLLQMDRLGNIRSDLWLTASGLRVMLVVADPEVKHLVDSHIRNLETLLRRHVGSLSVEVRVSDPVDTDIESDGSTAADFFNQRTIDTSA